MKAVTINPANSAGTRTGSRERELRILWGGVLLIFLIFLLLPLLKLFLQSFETEQGIGLGNYADVISQRGFLTAFGNSLLVSSVNALLTTALAFLLAYTIHYTNVGRRYKKILSTAAVVPMLLPTITYGFAIIYSFGKQGLLTQLFGTQLFDIYGFNGLLLGYMIYTFPISFLLISDAMNYTDKKFLIVSRVMGDSPFRTFTGTVIRPLLGTLASSFVQCFFLSFTDYGIPASLSGRYEVIATVLYNEMLGSIPDFAQGAVVAVLMLGPSVLSILFLSYLERYNIRYNQTSVVENRKCPLRDILCGGLSTAVLVCLLSVFAVIFLVPFIREWPYRMQFTLEHVTAVFEDPQLVSVYLNSLFTAFMTALFGALLVYAAALVEARSKLPASMKSVIESISLVTNTIPGMVIGIAFLLIFTGTPLQNTFFLIIICNIVHYFSTPFLMMQGSLSKMNASWETTARLMGDSWLQTVVRVVTPNAFHTLIEVFRYYFVNAMVTVSAVIFIAGARTMVITTKIKELQYYTRFNEVFVLSILILITNLAARGIFALLLKKR